MRILFIGSGEFGVPTFRSLQSDRHEIVAAVSQPDRAAGRGKAIQPTPLRQFAESVGVRVLTPADVNATDVVAELRGLRVDLAYVVAFGQKIGPEILAMFPAGIINLHGSLLPAYRGAAPVQRAVLNGELESGVTIFRLVEKMDAGPILAQRRTAIAPEETADDLHDRLARIGCDCLRAAIDRLIANPADPGEEQDASRATMAPKLKKSDGWADFTLPVASAAARINGLWSWPGAAARFVSADGKRNEVVALARVRPAQADPARTNTSPGALTDVLHVGCAAGELELLEIKPASGKLMDWRSFVNGRHVRPGDRFEPIEPAKATAS